VSTTLATPAAVAAPAPLSALWRLTLHRRTFSATAYPATTGLVELAGARSRRLETARNTPAKLTFTLDGRAPAAAAVQELTTDVLAWRGGELMFAGTVTQTEDVVSEQTHALNVTALDALGLLNRRYLTAPNPLAYAQSDQDAIVADLLAYATTGARSGDGTKAFAPGSLLPLAAARVFPDGSSGRPLSGVLRDRSYEGGSSIGELMTELGACIGGFDLDIAPTADELGHNTLRIFYDPAGGGQGVIRPELLLAYGSSVASLTRSVASGDYANYTRHLGTTETTGGPQTYADKWNADASSAPVGLWQKTENASDVKDPATLAQQAGGDLAAAGELVPSYSLTLRPGWYSPGNPAIGDTVGLMVQSGRLDVSTTVRVLGITYAVGDDGDENLELAVGRPAASLSALFRKTRRDIDALGRR
jgi:hypothetical protein